MKRLMLLVLEAYRAINGHRTAISAGQQDVDDAVDCVTKVINKKSAENVRAFEHPRRAHVRRTRMEVDWCLELAGEGIRAWSQKTLNGPPVRLDDIAAGGGDCSEALGSRVPDMDRAEDQAFYNYKPLLMLQ